MPASRPCVVAGTTGEAAALDAEERSDLLIAVRSAVDGRVPVLAGTGAPSARQAVVLSRRAADDGADALLVLSPAGVPDPRPYYERVAVVGRRPGARLPLPQGVGAGRARSTCSASSRSPASRTAPATPSASSSKPTRSRRACTPATPTLIHLAGAIGCSGAILALANVDPEGCLRAWKGDGTVQRELISGHRSNALAGIAGLKRALCALHGTSPVTRVGLTPATICGRARAQIGARSRAHDVDYRSSRGSRPRVRPGRSWTRFTARRTPGM